MRMRAHVGFASLAAITVLLASGSAGAQGSKPPLSMNGWGKESVDLVGSEKFFTESKLLGAAWQQVVTSTLDAVKRLAAVQPSTVTTPPPPEPTPPPSKPEPSAWAKLKIAPVADASGVKVVAPAPIQVEPVSNSLGDARGQRAVLLGAELRLPWTVP